jgi:hypothetical protein
MGVVYVAAAAAATVLLARSLTCIMHAPRRYEVESESDAVGPGLAEINWHHTVSRPPHPLRTAHPDGETTATTAAAAISRLHNVLSIR